MGINAGTFKAAGQFLYTASSCCVLLATTQTITECTVIIITVGFMGAVHGSEVSGLDLVHTVILQVDMTINWINRQTIIKYFKGIMIFSGIYHDNDEHKTVTLFMLVYVCCLLFRVLTLLRYHIIAFIRTSTSR